MINGKRKVKAICWAEKSGGGGENRGQELESGLQGAGARCSLSAGLCYTQLKYALKSCCSSDRSGSTAHCKSRTKAMPVQTSGAGIDESNTSLVIRFASHSHNIKYYKKKITFRCLRVSLPLKVKMRSGIVRDSALRRRTLRKCVGAAEATRLVSVAIRGGYDTGYTERKAPSSLLLCPNSYYSMS